MRRGERIFEAILCLAMAITLWNLIVLGAGRGVFVDVSGNPLGASTSGDDWGRNRFEQRPSVHLGASRREVPRQIGVDQAVLRLVMQR
jgi:hypothetical protein